MNRSKSEDKRNLAVTKCVHSNNNKENANHCSTRKDDAEKAAKVWFCQSSFYTLSSGRLLNCRINTFKFSQKLI